MHPRSEVVVIGGTGFIGRHLVRELRRREVAVRIVTRRPSATTHQPGVTYIEGDISRPDSLRQAIEGSSVVFHLATGGGATWTEFERDFVHATRRVAHLCLESGVRRLIYTSSIAALFLGHRCKIDERTGPDPRPHNRSLYSRAKVAAEQVLREMHVQHRLPVVIVRPGVVVGPGGFLQHGGVGNWASDLCGVGWGRGNEPLPFVLAEDVAAAMASAMDAPGIDGSTFNLVGDVRPTAAEFVEALADRSHRNFRFYPQSLWKLQAFEIAKWALKIAARKPDNQFPSYRDLVTRALRSQFDCSAAKEMLGWHPVADREQFLQQAIDANLPTIKAGDLRLVAASAR
jgi:nucleoside-diphosphate-sugar epimerase